MARVRAHAGPPVLWAILGLALVLRVGALLLTRDYVPFGDAADYDLHGVGLAVFGTYPPSTFAEVGSPAALRPPGYPYLLGALYDVTGLRYVAARGVGVLLGVATVALTWSVARRLWDARVAAWAAGVAAVVPALVWLPAALLAETLFTPLVLAAVLCLLVHRDRPARRWVAAAGALVALAALTRSNGIVLLLPVLLGAWVARRRAADAGIALLCAVVVLVPWTVRNASALGSFSPLGTQSGFTMAGAWNAEAAKDGEYFAAWRVPIDLPVYADVMKQPGTTEADVDRELRSRALDYAADHPGFVLRSSAVHLGRLFELGPDQGPTDDLSLREMGVPEGHRFALRWGVWALVLLAVAGAVAARRRPGPRAVPAWLVLVPVLLIVGVAPLLGPPRYRVPVDPFLALPAGVALAAASSAVAGRRGRTRAAAADAA